jgi:hypothetical protein
MHLSMCTHALMGNMQMFAPYSPLIEPPSHASMLKSHNKNMCMHAVHNPSHVAKHICVIGGHADTNPPGRGKGTAPG